MLKPSPLKLGSTIGIAASASHFDKPAFLKGAKLLESKGFKLSYRPDIFDKHRYLAGDDKRRADELIGLLTDPQIDALLFARGGYGMMRLLPCLDRIQLPPKPKIVLGYSDITSLLIYLQNRAQWVTFYGPVVAKDLSDPKPETLIGLLNAVMASSNPLLLHSSETVTLKSGSSSGILTGGCLTLVAASLGTPYEIKTDGSILFLEDINEKPYSVDRMLTQLKLAGKFEGVKGVVFGSFENTGTPDEHLREAILDVLSAYDIPILYNFPAGHGPIKMTLPLGLAVELNADKKELRYFESATA